MRLGHDPSLGLSQYFLCPVSAESVLQISEDLRLYILVRTVSAGCIAAQTHTPLMEDAARYVVIELSFQPFLTSMDLPRL